MLSQFREMRLLFLFQKRGAAISVVGRGEGTDSLSEGVLQVGVKNWGWGWGKC